MTFTVATPTAFADVFVVTVDVGGSTLAAEYRVFAAYTGPPSATRTLAKCTPINPRAGSVLTCVVAFLSSSSATSVIEDDITITPLVTDNSLRRRLAVDMPSAQNISSSDGGKTYSFVVVLPVTPVLQLTVSIYVSGIEITSFATEVFGIPATSSTLACHGLVSKSGFVAIDETVNCTITVNDDAGASTGLATDFVVHVDNALENPLLETHDGGHTFQFQVTSPNSSAPAFVVSVSLSSAATAISQSPASLTLICKGGCVMCIC